MTAADRINSNLLWIAASSLVLVGASVIWNSIVIKSENDDGRDDKRRRTSTTIRNVVSPPIKTTKHVLGILADKTCPTHVVRTHDAKTDLLHRGHSTGGKLVIVMVGLPGRGKSYMARKIARYLNWLDYRTKVFNIGSYRRSILGTDHFADFFDPHNKDGMKLRQDMANCAMDAMLSFLQADGGEVAIFDGTNSTIDRRKWIEHRLKSPLNYYVLFLESICTDQNIVSHNIIETKLRSPDYEDYKSSEAAVVDFKNRIRMYEKCYESLGPCDTHRSYVQVINAGERLILNRVQGFLPMKITSFVTNLHIMPRPVMLCAHGESTFDGERIRRRLGGHEVATLSSNGRAFTRSLTTLLSTHESFSSEELCVWTSTALAARQTAGNLKCKQYVQWRALRELEVGIMDGMTLQEIQKAYPEEEENRHRSNKLSYRYPQGESFLDVISRLEAVIYELERVQAPVVIIAHENVLRCLYAYFLDIPSEKLPYVSIPLHTVIELHPSVYGCIETRRALEPSLL